MKIQVVSEHTLSGSRDYLAVESDGHRWEWAIFPGLFPTGPTCEVVGPEARYLFLVAGDLFEKVIVAYRMCGIW